MKNKPIRKLNGYYLSVRGIIKLRFQCEGVNIFYFDKGESVFYKNGGNVSFNILEALKIKQIPISLAYEAGIEKCKEFIYELTHYRPFFRELETQKDLYYLFVEPIQMKDNWSLRPNYNGNGGVYSYEFNLTSIYRADFLDEKFKNHSQLFINCGFHSDNDLGSISINEGRIFVPNELIDNFSIKLFNEWFKKEVTNSKDRAIKHFNNKIEEVTNQSKKFKKELK